MHIPQPYQVISNVAFICPRQSFGGQYLELVPGERLVYTNTFDDPDLPGEMTVSVTLKPVSLGTEMVIEQQGIPDEIPPDGCYPRLAIFAAQAGKSCGA